MRKFDSLGLKGGIWQGILSGSEPPARLVLVHLGERIAEARVTPHGDGQWLVAAAIPVQKLSDGIQSFLLIEDGGKAGEAPQPDALHIASFNVLSGQPLAEDLQAELALIRSELDLLKRELRRLARDKAQ